MDVDMEGKGDSVAAPGAGVGGGGRGKMPGLCFPSKAGVGGWHRPPKPFWSVESMRISYFNL